MFFGTISTRARLHQHGAKPRRSRMHPNNKPWLTGKAKKKVLGSEGTNLF